MDESTKYLDDLTKKLPDYFGILPKAELQVKRVEAFREQDGAPQHYSAGTRMVPEKGPTMCIIGYERYAKINNGRRSLS
ncbi:hypothetical protein Q2T40_01305 [Winogradskyella maritima]|nr:hypothetical protein [Winogradskyella maritima]